jgi:hypothetical protein
MLQDPQFEQVPATRLHRRAFGRKTHRKAVDHDGKILTKVKRRAHELDTLTAALEASPIELASAGA